MKVRVELLCWNESELLPLAVLHYSRFADEIIVWDNYSDDGSREIARQLGCDVRMFGKEGQLDDRSYLSVKNAESSGVDWRIVCDMDELLDITREQLEEELEKGTTVLKTRGVNIYSDLLPDKDLFEINSGFIDPSFSKKVCYNPSQISGMNYSWGAHHCKPSGRVFESQKVYDLRHYRCIGGVEKMIDRHSQYKKRMSQYNLQNRLSFHYMRTEQAIREEWSRNIAKVKPFK